MRSGKWGGGRRGGGGDWHKKKRGEGRNPLLRDASPPKMQGVRRRGVRLSLFDGACRKTEGGRGKSQQNDIWILEEEEEEEEEEEKEKKKHSGGINRGDNYTHGTKEEEEGNHDSSSSVTWQKNIWGNASGAQRTKTEQRKSMEWQKSSA